MSGIFLRQSGGGSRGFTMIELVVVMIIIGIAFAAVQPALGRTLRASRDRAALRQVIAVLTGAHARAVTEGRLVRVIMAPEEGEMWAEIQADPAIDRTQFVLLPVLGKQHLEWPEELAIGAMSIGGVNRAQVGGTVIYFYPDGRTSGASFEFDGSAGHAYFVDLSPATGRVQIGA